MNAPVSLCWNGRLAVALAEADFFVFPCFNNPSHPNHKKPLVQWLDKSTKDPEQVRAMWLAEYRNALPGIDLSRSGLIVVDGDLHHEGQDGPSSIEMILGQKLSDIGCPVVVTPSGGVHCYFLQPRLPGDDGNMALGNGTGSLPYGIDIRGHGGYVIAPGAATGDKRLYRRLPGTEELIDAFHAGTIPYLPDAIVEAIRAGREDKRVVTEIDAPQPRVYAKSGNREGAWGAAALENELRRIADAPKGARNNVLAAKAFYLGTIAARGWIDPSAAIAGMMAAVKGWTDPKKTISTLNRCFTAGLGFPHDDLPTTAADGQTLELGRQASEMLLRHSWGHEDAAARKAMNEAISVARAQGHDVTNDGEIIQPPNAGADGMERAAKAQERLNRAQREARENTRAQAGETVIEVDVEAAMEAAKVAQIETGIALDYAEELWSRGGLVADIAAWIYSTARVRRKRFALAGALAIVAVATGRRYSTPTMAELNIFTIMVTRSGSGKEAAISCMKSLFRAAGLENLIGPGGVKSDTALYVSLNNKPVQCMALDEFGDTLAQLNGRNAHAHQQGILPALRKVYGGGYLTPEYAATRGDLTTNRPALTILAASTPGQFFDAISEKDAENGTLNRFIMFYDADHVPISRVDYSNNVPPEYLVESLRSLSMVTSMGMDTAAFHNRLINTEIIDTHAIEWSREASDLGHDYESKNADEAQHNRQRESLGPRLALNALKIASILAVGDDIDNPFIETEHIRLGIMVAEGSFSDMSSRWGRHVRQTEEGAFIQKVFETVAEAPGKFLTLREIHKRFRNGRKNTIPIERAIEQLLKSGELVKATMKNKRGPQSEGVAVMVEDEV